MRAHVFTAVTGLWALYSRYMGTFFIVVEIVKLDQPFTAHAVYFIFSYIGLYQKHYNKTVMYISINFDK